VTAVVNHLPPEDIVVTDTELIWKWDSMDGDIVETNGKVLSKEGHVYVVWPTDAPELRLTARVSRPGPNSHLPLLKLLRDQLVDEDEAANRF
jgi:hypothetical protein